ncbi:probable serine/threonine-protein kinase clkA [Metopolophium dirhodum]|uniref:probable serine/threonine-protein kinase clkA n=1 Tax=Metopolophium dirhodum TaxID=44670 RepID=UPI00298FC423|nr:probable serine/threonine-protein kinase clkA [Metopolophium dirhodum]
MSESDSSDIDTSSADSSIKVENYKSRKELKEAVLKDAVKKEFLEQTRKHIVKTEKTVRKNLVRTHSLTEQIGTTPRKQTVGRLGTRSDSSVIHMQLESVVKKKTSKMDLDKAIAMIPICTGKKDVAEFINICEIAIKETTEADTPILLKIITSKLTGNALEADVNNEEKRQNGGNTNNAVNRGGNGNSNQSNRNNNFNGYNNRYVNHNNRNNYGNNNQSGYGSHMVNRGGHRGGNGYGRNFNGNNVQQNNINRGTGCYTCGRSNHIARDCWSNRPNAQQNTYNNNRVSGTRHANNSNNVRRDNNNTQGVLCSYCNKIGHEISNCYTKQKNERSTSGNANGPSPVGVRLVQEIVQDPHTGFSTSQQN